MPSHAIQSGQRVRPRMTLRRGIRDAWRSLPGWALLLTALQLAGTDQPSRGSALSQVLHTTGNVLLGAAIAAAALGLGVVLPARIRRWAGDAMDPRPRWQYVLAGLCLLGVAAATAPLSLRAGTGLTTRLSETAFIWCVLYGLLQIGRAACSGRLRSLLWWPPLTATARTAGMT